MDLALDIGYGIIIVFLVMVIWKMIKDRMNENA
jgi:hypothetical protein